MLIMKVIVPLALALFKVYRAEVIRGWIYYFACVRACVRHSRDKDLMIRYLANENE